MTRRLVVSVVLGLASVCGTEAVYAAPAALPMPVRAMFGKTKLVKFELRNETGSPLKLQCGEQTMTIETGKTMPLALAVGTRVASVEATTKLPAGSTIAMVTGDMAGVTIAVH